MAKLIFCKSKDIGGFLIRLFTLSKWNHVAWLEDMKERDASIGKKVLIEKAQDALSCSQPAVGILRVRRIDR